MLFNAGKTEPDDMFEIEPTDVTRYAMDITQHTDPRQLVCVEFFRSFDGIEWEPAGSFSRYGDPSPECSEAYIRFSALISADGGETWIAEKIRPHKLKYAVTLNHGSLVTSFSIKNN